MSWYPTPSRVQLLADIAAGDVLLDPTADGTQWFWVDPCPPHGKRMVTARVGEAVKAGWVEVEAQAGELLPCPVLTHAGWQLLDGER